MNILLLTPEDFTGTSKVLLKDDRARHVLEILRATVGQTIRVGLVNGNLGEAVVEEITGKRVTLHVRLDHPAPRTGIPITLLVALPRPQTLKKILEVIAAAGVKELFLTQSGRVQKSYFSSKLLQNEAWMRHLRLGLEQGCRTEMPKISVDRSLRGLLDRLGPPSLDRIPRLLLDPSAEESLWQTQLAGGDQPEGLIASIGPEGGWLPDEKALFLDHGFQPIRLGQTIHRVENAVTSFLAQLELFSLSDRPAG